MLPLRKQLEPRIGILLSKVWVTFVMFVQSQKSTVVKTSGRVLQKDKNVVVVEDLISTGNSSLMYCGSIAAGANMQRMAAIFYNGFAVAEENFES
jgi:orotate phosphoribosyltransferase